MYTMTEARYSDVEDVMHDMSDLSLQEMAACGVKHAWHGLKRAKVCKDKGFLKVMRDDKGPLFVFGAAEMNPGVFRTWFIGTERYFDLTGAVTQCVVVGLALLDWSGTPRAGLSLRQQLLAAMVLVGLGRIVALCYRSSASCQIH